nr:aminoglycoside 6-adenylyltransferase [Bacillus pakistanensis]
MPKDRERILEVIENDLLDDKNIEAVFYGGSIGNENPDLYSDIDLRIIVAEDSFEEYRKNKRVRATNWGRVLFYEDNPQSNYTVIHFDCFIKVDCFYYRQEDLRPSVWLQNSKIALDRNGIMAEIQKKSKNVVYTPTVEEVEFWRTKFFAYIHEVYRRVKRDEIYYALKCLDSMRLLITTGWYMDAGFQPNGLGDWAKIEGKRSLLNSSQLTLLKSWDCSRDGFEILKMTKRMIPEFKRIHQSLCEKLGVVVDSDWVEEIINKVL